MNRIIILIGCLIIFATYETGYAQTGHSMVKQWVQTFGGFGISMNTITAMTVDDEGNVYVTGRVNWIDAGYDYLTIKYDTTGNMVWAARFDGVGRDDEPTAIAIDSQRNVVVTGRSQRGDGKYNYSTVKYDAAGDELWVRTFNGDQDRTDIAFAVTINSEDEIYITGATNLSSDQGLDGTHGGFVTIKYGANGQAHWMRKQSLFGEIGPIVMTLDSSENVIVAGNSYIVGEYPSYGFRVEKYSPTGDTLWSKGYSTRAQYDVPMAITVDADDNIVISGFSQRTPTRRDVLTMKLNQNGQQIWNRSYASPYYENSTDPNSPLHIGQGISTNIDVDEIGNIFVAGLFQNGISSYMMGVLRYDSDGRFRWLAWLPGPASASVSVSRPSVRTDSQGNFYLSGSGIEAGMGGITTVKFSPLGATLWVDHFHVPLPAMHAGMVMQRDGTGNLFVGGSAFNSNAGQDYVIIKYTPGLPCRQVNLGIPITHHQPASSTLNCHVLTPPLNSITEATEQIIESVDVTIEEILHSRIADLTIILEYQGVVDTLVFEAGGNGSDFKFTKFSDVATNSIYDGMAPFTGVYRPHKPLEAYYGLPAGGEWILRVIDNYPENDGVLNSWSVYMTTGGVQTSIDNGSPGVPGVFSLSQNYPNPFNPSTTIFYTLDEKQFTLLGVYDITGREVARLVSGEQQPGRHSVVFDASRLATGVYFYTLRAGSRSETRKMVYLR